MADIGQIQLSVLYKQPLDGCFTYDADGRVATYQELWKGNFTHITNTYQTLQNWQPTGVDDYQDYNDFVTAAGGTEKLSYYYDKPTIPTDKTWKLDQAEVSEIKAGDNATLKLTWVIPYLNFDPEVPELSDWTESWNLSWQSKTASIYAYCGNLSVHLSGGGDMRSQKAQRTAIENWNNLPNEFAAAKNQFYYQSSQTNTVKLNDAEINIAKKIMQGKTQVIYHYPIVTYTKSITCPKEKVNEAISKLNLLPADTIQQMQGCPFTVPLPPGGTSWQWLLQGCDVNTTQIVSKNSSGTTDEKWKVTLTQVAWGAVNTQKTTGWDMNFYGDGNTRWLFGMA